MTNYTQKNRNMGFAQGVYAGKTKLVIN